MDWTKWIADLLAAGIGGLIGGTVGAYFKSYSEEKGKHLATYEDIASLLAQERGKAYEQEAGKRAATREDIGNVLKEVHVVTEKTETIKAQIGSDLWTRQKVWEQKREAYAKVLGVSHDLRECLIDLNQASQASKRAAGEERRRVADQKFGEVQNRYSLELAPALIREIDIAEIFLGSQARKLLQEFRDWRQSIESGTEFDVRAEFVRSWRARLIEAAQPDLGAVNSIFKCD
jgi:hypothetical protein